MKTFSYEIIDRNNKKQIGKIEAKDKFEVIRSFQSQGNIVIHVEEYFNFSLSKILEIEFGGINQNEKLLFLKQLSTMMLAGLPISEALSTLAMQTKDRALKKQLEKVTSEVQTGTSLFDAFSKTKGIFSSVQMNLLDAGEKSGNLVDIIQKITSDLARSKNFTSKVQGALIYPVIILFTALIVMYVLMVYMMPAIADLFKRLNAEDKTPFVTKLLIDFANAINPSNFGFYLILTGILSVVIGFYFYRRSTSGRLVTDGIFMKIPVFGELSSKLDISQFCRILSLLISSGINISEAIQITSGAVSNKVYQNAILNIIPDIEKGGTIAVAMNKYKVFPPVLVRMVATGEQSGKLEQVLSDMATFYEDDVENMSSNLTKLLEPLILLIVGGFVALLAIAVYLPIYQISQAFGQ